MKKRDTERRRNRERAPQGAGTRDATLHTARAANARARKRHSRHATLPVLCLQRRVFSAVQEKSHGLRCITDT